MCGNAVTNSRISCKAWPVREGKHFSKQAFTAGLWTGRAFAVQQNRRCPLSLVGLCIFPKKPALSVRRSAQCRTSANGRSVSIHPDEALLTELRERKPTPQGRTHLRERVAVEHTLAHVGRGPGPTGVLSWYSQKSLRSAPVRCRPQFTCSGSFPTTLC